MSWMSRTALWPSEDADAPPTPFYPNFILLEALAALGLFVVILVVGAMIEPTLEAAANPNAYGYVPRPEWYFLWFFQLLTYFNGNLEPIVTVLVPAAAFGLLAALPFLDRREPKTRVLVAGTRPVRVWPRVIGALAVLWLASLTFLALVRPAPPPPDAQPSPIVAPEWP